MYLAGSWGFAVDGGAEETLSLEKVSLGEDVGIGGGIALDGVGANADNGAELDDAVICVGSGCTVASGSTGDAIAGSTFFTSTGGAGGG
jgi:hypothetical protein